MWVSVAGAIGKVTANVRYHSGCQTRELPKPCRKQKGKLDYTWPIRAEHISDFGQNAKRPDHGP
jgi:hypothetical protein